MPGQYLKLKWWILWAFKFFFSFSTQCNLGFQWNVWSCKNNLCSVFWFVGDPVSLLNSHKLPVRLVLLIFNWWLSFSNLEKARRGSPIWCVSAQICTPMVRWHWDQESDVLGSVSGAPACISTSHLYKRRLPSWVVAELTDIGRNIIKTESHGIQYSQSQCRYFWFLKINSLLK